MSLRPSRLTKPLKRRTRTAFSLIELLVVIAIIAILFSMLFPSMHRMRQRIETITCASNLRQIMLATDMYATNNSKGGNEYVNKQRWVVQNYSQGGLWVNWAGAHAVPEGLLFPYLPDESAFLCPTFKKTAKINPAFSHLTPYVGYSMNEHLASGEHRGSWFGLTNIGRSQIVFPAKLGIYADEGTTPTPINPWVINNLMLLVGPYQHLNSHIDGFGSFHDSYDGHPTHGKANVVFADGHVELVDPHLPVRPDVSKEIFTPELFKALYRP
jgi:prepilin-type N-terminal cleavage/methylation domain-containing protein/prepilin-type processing-associated H-X9-DG protein